MLKLWRPKNLSDLLFRLRRFLYAKMMSTAMTLSNAGARGHFIRSAKQIGINISRTDFPNLPRFPSIVLIIKDLYFGGGG